MCHHLEKKFAFSHGVAGGILILICFANVFQTDDKINSEPKIKKLEPVLLPGKHESSGRYFIRQILA